MHVRVHGPTCSAQSRWQRMKLSSLLRAWFCYGVPLQGQKRVHHQGVSPVWHLSFVNSLVLKRVLVEQCNIDGWIYIFVLREETPPSVLYNIARITGLLHLMFSHFDSPPPSFSLVSYTDNSSVQSMVIYCDSAICSFD